MSREKYTIQSACTQHNPRGKKGVHTFAFGYREKRIAWWEEEERRYSIRMVSNKKNSGGKKRGRTEERGRKEETKTLLSIRPFCGSPWWIFKRRHTSWKALFRFPIKPHQTHSTHTHSTHSTHIEQQSKATQSKAKQTLEHASTPQPSSCGGEKRKSGSMYLVLPASCGRILGGEKRNEKKGRERERQESEWKRESMHSPEHIIQYVLCCDVTYFPHVRENMAPNTHDNKAFPRSFVGNKKLSGGIKILRKSRFLSNWQKQGGGSHRECLGMARSKSLNENQLC